MADSFTSKRYPSLRVAYIDEVDEALKEKTEGKTEKVYYSVLIKGDTINYSERVSASLYEINFLNEFCLKYLILNLHPVWNLAILNHL